MPLTIISLAINFLIGGAIWISCLSIIAKVFITILLVAKFALYFWSAVLAEHGPQRGIGLTIVAILNAVGIIYTALNCVWTAMVPLIIILILLIIWGSISIGNPIRKDGNE